MYTNLVENFENDQVTIKIQYNLVEDIHDYKTILNHIKNSIEYNIVYPRLLEKQVDHAQDLATYTFTATVI